MALMKLTKQRRELVADKLMDGANLLMTGLVVAQLLSESPRWSLIILALAIYIIAWLISLKVRR